MHGSFRALEARDFSRVRIHKFAKNSVGLAMVEFSPEKNNIQTVVYGNGNAEDYTHLIEHENILQNEKSKPSLTDQLRSAEARLADVISADNSPAREDER